MNSARYYLLVLLIGFNVPGCYSIPWHENEMEELPEPKYSPHKEIPIPFSDLQKKERQDFGPEILTPEWRWPKQTDEIVTGPFSLQQLQALARKHNPTLVQAWAVVEGERAKALQAGLYPNPIGGYRGRQIDVVGTPGEFQGGFLRQEIVTAGKLELSRQLFLERATAAEYQALAQEYRVMNALLIQFYRLLGFQERVNIQKELLKSWEDELFTMQERFNVGQANEADVRRARVQLRRQQLTVLMTQNALQLERERLLTLVGIPLPPEPVQGNLTEELPPIQFDEALQRLLRESPQLGLAHANVRSDQIRVQREQVEPIPNIFIQGSAGRNYVETQTVYGAEVFIEIPIFDLNQGTIQQARADLRRQQSQVTLVELQLRRDLAFQYQQYLTALQHITTYREDILPEAEDRYRTQLLSYHTDREDWPAVLEAQRDFFMLRLEYIDQLINWRTARVAIDGLLLIEGLNPPAEVTPPGHIRAVPKPR